MNDQTELNLSDSAGVLRAAAAWDRSYQEGKVVMLAGYEIVGFCRHHFGQHHLGRRRDDQNLLARVEALETENAALKQQLAILKSPHDCHTENAPA